jgi:hypothetical protein
MVDISHQPPLKSLSDYHVLTYVFLIHPGQESMSVTHFQTPLVLNLPIVKLLHEDQPPFLNSTNMRHMSLLAIPDVGLWRPVINERWIGIRISWQCFG